MHSSIDFYKTMSWGNTITQAFSFIRIHARTLLLGNFYYVFPFFLTYFIASYFLKLTPHISFDANVFENLFPYSGTTVLLLLMLLLAGASMALTVNGNVIKAAFLNNNQLVTLNDVKKNIFPEVFANALYIIVFIILLFVFLIGAYLVILIGSFLLMALAGFLGMIGIVLMALLMFVFYSFIFSYIFACTGLIFVTQQIERKGIFEAIGRNFQLIHHSKKNFWGGIIISFLILTVLQVLNLSLTWPMLVIGFIIEFTTGELPTTLAGFTAFYSKFELLLSIGSTITTPLWGIASYTCVAFLYFNLSERTDARGLKKRIEKIGAHLDFNKDSYNKIV